MADMTMEKFNQIKQRADEIISRQSKVKDMFNALADMYWISETDESRLSNSSKAINYNHDAYSKDEIRLTATTSSRDRVTGLHRLLRASKPAFSVKCKNKGYADKIERALDKWWEASNSRKRATLESELTLSGILFSDINLQVTSVDDLLEVEGVSKVRKNRLTQLRKKTPILFEEESPMVAYPVWGEDGKSEHLTVVELLGRKLRERWGVQEVKDDMKYTLYDYWDTQYVCTWYSEGNGYLRAGEHGLLEIPHFSSITDGTDLFEEEERKRNPFLYGAWKSGLHKREDETLTSLATSTFARGHGPLLLIDKSAAGYEEEALQVQHAGLVRYLAAHGNPKLADDKAFDSNLISLYNMWQVMGERTTIPAQTLGENIEAGTPYSGYALASQNGRIPIIPVQIAAEKVIHDACVYALMYFKENNMDWEGLKPSEILDDFELTVTLEVDLPQDKVRSAQFLASLKQSGIPLSNEWIHNELQIRDSKKMTFDVMSEQAYQLAFQQDAPMLVQQVSQMLQSLQAPPQGPIQGQIPNPPSPEYAAGPGPAAAQTGGEVTPATEPLPPEQVNRG